MTRSGTAKRYNADLISWLILIVPPLLWATNFAVGRAARDDVAPVTLTFARHLIALVALLPFAFARMRRDMPRYWGLRWLLLKVSLSGLVAFNLLVYGGLHSTTASNALLLNSAAPVLIMLLGVIFYDQRLGAMQLVGLALSSFGVVTIILHGELARVLTLDFSQGDLIMFAAIMSFALFSIWLREFPADMDRVGLLGAQLVIATIVLAPLALSEVLVGNYPSITARGLAAMAYIGIVPACVASLLYMFGVARVGPGRAGLFIHLVPVYGTVISSLFLGEQLHLYHAFGMILILTGLLLSRMPATDHREASTAQTS
jgi:drug/metabolite transporter (DMT)-like permease